MTRAGWPLATGNATHGYGWIGRVPGDDVAKALTAEGI